MTRPCASAASCCARGLTTRPGSVPSQRAWRRTASPSPPPRLRLLGAVPAPPDRERRVALFAELLALGAQAWLTGTDEELFAELRPAAQFLTVRDAAIAAA